MTEGQSIHTLEFRETSLTGLPEARFFLAASVACGYRLAGRFPVDDYLDTGTDDLAEFHARLAADPASIRRVVRISYDSTVKATFCPPGGFEQVSISEFRKRWEDTAWMAANPEHPIAYQAALIAQLKSVSTSLRNAGRIRLVKGDRECFLMQNPRRDPKIEADNAQYLEWFRNGLPAK